MGFKDESSSQAIVIAALNEEEGIGPTLEEIHDVFPRSRVVVVDGNSTDRTVEVAESFGVEVVRQRGRGKGDAMALGVRRLDRRVRYIVFTDADFTYPAEFIPKMVEVLDHDADVGMVLGNRFNGEHNFDCSASNPFYAGNRLLAFAQFVFNGLRLNDPLSGLRVVRSELLRGWELRGRGFDVEAELNSLVNRKGYEIAEVSIPYRQRLGEKKLKLRHGLEILNRIVLESFRIN